MLSRTTPLRSVDVVDAAFEVKQFSNINLVEPIQRKTIPVFSQDNSNIIHANFIEQKSAEKVVTAELKVFFTKDQDLLEQYYALRYESYREEWGFENFAKSETEFDRQGQIIVALKNGQLVGGACVMFSADCEYLSNEIPGTRYNYRDVLKSLGEREGLNYSEVSGVVVAKDHRDRSVTEQMFEKVISESKNRNCDYIVGISFLSIAREYRIIFKRLSHQLVMALDYPWKQKEIYNFLRMFPMCVKVL